MTDSDILNTITYSIETGTNEVCINESREFYLNIIKDPVNAKNNIDNMIINKIKRKYRYSEDETINLSLKIINKTDLSTRCITISNNILFIGRLPINDIIVGEETNDVSRIHCVCIKIGDVIYIVDTWSSNGTTSLKLGSNLEIKSLPYSRKIMSFNSNEQYMISLPNYIIVFNQDIQNHNEKNCIICLENPRRLRLSCGHGITCVECGKILFNENRQIKCPLCRTHGHAEVSECVDTMLSV